MKPVTTLVAIAVVAGIFVLGGFAFLDGMQPQGPLQGSLGPTPTNLTLNISPCTEPEGWLFTPGALNFTLSGYLRDANGNPVPGRTVTFTARGVLAGGMHYVGEPGVEGSAVTAADGSFSLQKQELPTAGYGTGAYEEFVASFAGDTQYVSSSSNYVKKLC
jgi:hypothetical protein